MVVLGKVGILLRWLMLPVMRMLVVRLFVRVVHWRLGHWGDKVDHRLLVHVLRLMFGPVPAGLLGHVLVLDLLLFGRVRLLVLLVDLTCVLLWMLLRLLARMMLLVVLLLLVLLLLLLVRVLLRRIDLLCEGVISMSVTVSWVLCVDRTGGMSCCE
uniref:Uncharacterized protein n=1 Tax=Anopheles merus TaxID=30066 RepID=A0A182UYL9_ANOME